MHLPRHRTDGTRQSVEPLDQALELLDLTSFAAGCPATEDIAPQASLARLDAPVLRDLAVMSSATSKERVEISARHACDTVLHR